MKKSICTTLEPELVSAIQKAADSRKVTPSAMIRECVKVGLPLINRDSKKRNFFGA